MALHRGWITDLCPAPAARLLFSASLDSTIVVWREQGRALQVLEHSSGPVHSLVYNAGKRTLLAGGTGFVFMYKLSGNTSDYREMVSSSMGAGGGEKLKLNKAFYNKSY
jgi:WD40 repeat protein